MCLRVKKSSSLVFNLSADSTFVHLIVVFGGNHYGMAGMGLSTDNATYEWCKRLWMCVHVERQVA